MSLVDILNVGIVLAATYVSLSCVCSWINEQIASMLRLRGQYLYNGILNLLLGDKGLVDAVFAHPLITSTSRDPDGRPRPKALPSAIAAGAAPQGAAAGQPPAAVPTASPGSPLARVQAKLRPNLGYRPSYLDARSFSIAFWQSAQEIAGGPKVQQVSVEPAALMTSLSEAVQALPDRSLARILSSYLTQSKGDYEKLLGLTDSWFNAQMDRVSGWYRRKTQWIIVIIASLVVTYLGIDSLAVIKTLSTDPSATQQAVSHILSSLPTPTLAPNPAVSPPTPSPSPAAGALSAAPTPDPESELVRKFAETVQQGAQGADKSFGVH